MNTGDEPQHSLSLASSMSPHTEARNLNPTFPRISCSWGSDRILNSTRSPCAHFGTRKWGFRLLWGWISVEDRVVKTYIYSSTRLGALNSQLPGNQQQRRRRQISHPASAYWFPTFREEVVAPLAAMFCYVLTVIPKGPSRPCSTAFPLIS